MVLTKEQIEQKLKQGWLQANMMFEVLAVTEEAAKEALQSHMEKMGRNSVVEMVKKDFSQTEKVEKPMEGIESGFSQICSTEFLVKNLESLLHLVMEFGPASVEIMKPDKYQLNVGEAQNILNIVAEMMHRFAAAGLGGIVIARAGSEGQNL